MFTLYFRLTPLAKSSVSPGDLQLLRKNVCSYLGNDEMEDESISLNSEILTLSQAVPKSDENHVRRKWTLADGKNKFQNIKT